MPMPGTTVAQPAASCDSSKSNRIAYYAFYCKRQQAPHGSRHGMILLSVHTLHARIDPPGPCTLGIGTFPDEAGEIRRMNGPAIVLQPVRAGCGRQWSSTVVTQIVSGTPLAEPGAVPSVDSLFDPLDNFVGPENVATEDNDHVPEVALQRIVLAGCSMAPSGTFGVQTWIASDAVATSRTPPVSARV